MIVRGIIGLRALEREDLPLLMQWRNRPDYRRFFREYRELGRSDQERWFERSVVDDNSTIMFGVVDVESGALVGCCGLCYINWVQRYADLSLYIGSDGVYIDQDGYAEDACRALFDYGFGELGLHKIWTEIYEFDSRKNELYLSLGFRQDGLLRDNYFHAGRWWSSRIMSLLECDWTIEGLRPGI